MAKEIAVEEMMTVGALADKLQVPVTKLIAELMKNGVMATVNERIDFDTAQIIVDELKLDAKLSKVESTTQVNNKKAVSADGVKRPPVVTMMGHVDHGKTSLLDAIRGSKVTDKEAGGITQHISAYQIKHNDRLITFLDTPGHEAFAAIRQHGARLTDIAVIVVAADDGVKPQTREAIRFARDASVKIVVAINKIDKPAADVNLVKQQLSENDILVEDWGGEVVAVPVSAKSGEGLDKLLDMILLLADVEDIKADINGPARGLVIESHIDPKRGPVAHALVEAGTLMPGQFFVAGSTYGKVRNLDSVDNKPLKFADPATPVTITGFRNLPEFAEELVVVDDEKAARLAAAEKSAKTPGNRLNVGSSELIRMMNRSSELEELKVIVKADVQGSLTSVIDSLKSLDTDEVAVRLVASGVGAINDNDVRLALTSDAIIYGFNVTAAANIRRQAARDKVSLRLFRVIYELIDDAKVELSRLLKPTITETNVGRLIVHGVFKTTKNEIICGGEVTKGNLIVPATVKIIRGDKEIAEAEAINLKRGPQDVKEVNTGEMCGVSLKTQSRFEVTPGDRLEFFTHETKERQL